MEPAEEDFDARLDALRALAEPTRLRLARVLCQAELTVTEATRVIAQSQPSVSRHLGVLTAAGLVERHQEGACAFYQATLAPAYRRLIQPLGGPPCAEDDARLAVLRAEGAAAVAAYFADRAEDWDASRATQSLAVAMEAAVREEVAAVAGGARVAKLVDLGTGTGRMLLSTADLYDEAIGYDDSPQMLRVARGALREAANPAARVRRADIFDLAGGADDGEADVVLLHDVLHFLPDPGGAIAVAGALVGAEAGGGGHVVVADLAPHGREDLRASHAHRRLGFDDARMEGWARAAGLRLDRVRRVPCGGEPEGRVWRLSAAPNDTSESRPDRARTTREAVVHV